MLKMVTKIITLVSKKIKMDTRKKIFCPKIYPLDGDMRRKWWIRYYTKEGTTSTRHTIRVPKNIPTAPLRLDWANKVIEQLLTGTPPKVADVSANPHIKRLIEIIDSKKISKKTRCSYKGHVARLNAFCMSKSIQSVDNQTAIAFLEHLALSVKGRTANHHRRTLMSLFGTMLKRKEIKVNPFEDTDKAPTKKPFSEHWSDKEITLIMNRVREIKPQLELPMMVILHCATRNGREMPNLKVKDIDFDAAMLWIDDQFSKNQEREAVKIPNALMRVFKALNIDQCEKELYLLTKEGKPSTKKVGQNYFNNQFKIILKDLGIDKKGKGFYRLKNSLAVKLVKAKTNTWALKQQFRHKSIKTTEKYLTSLSVDDFPELEDFSFF